MDRKKRIYLASPFFNEEQVKRVNLIRDHLMENGIDVYSPMHDSKFKLGPNPGIEQAKKVFDDNVDNILNSDIVVAIMDDNDTGTYFEVGVATSKSIKVIKVVFDADSLSEDNRSLVSDFKSTVEYRYVNDSSTLLISKSDGTYRLKRLVELINKIPFRYPNVLYIIPSGGGTPDKYTNDAINLLEKYSATTFSPDSEYDLTVLDAHSSLPLHIIDKILSSSDYVILDRKDRYVLPAVLWGMAYYRGVPVIAVGKESSSNLMLQPSTTYNAKDYQDAIDFIISTKYKFNLDVIKYRGTGLLGKEEVI